MSLGFSEQALQLELGTVARTMRAALRCRNKEIQECVDGLLANNGKLLRPRLVLLSWRAAQANPPDETDERVFRAAAGIELLHMATLVHDDVIDRAPVRRARPSVYASHGTRTAILVGDLLFAAAFQLVADLADQSLGSQLAAAIRSLTESEILQMERADPAAPSYRRYLHQIIGKTAILFGLSCRVGAELAQAQPPLTQALQRCGYNIGMAFQIIDDIIDFQPDDRKSGKTPGRDIEQGILTLPVLVALNKGLPGGAKARELAELLRGGAPGQAGLDRVRSLVEELGGFSGAYEWVGRYTRRALRECARLHPGVARRLLEGVVMELETRR